MKNGALLLAITIGFTIHTSAFAQQKLAEWRLDSSYPFTGGGHNYLHVLVAGNATAASVAQFNTPATIRSAYNLPANTGANAIAIVDAYDYPTALKDFNYFSSYFALPTETSTISNSSNNHTFQVVYASGTRPASGGSYISSWNLEAALDIEWAHAMAPRAKIYLVEAASASYGDLMNAVLIAARLTGVKEVSMSWGGSEFSSEAYYYDSYFSWPSVVFFASSGDTSATMEYPAASPNVIACGGTSINRNASGTFLSETAWANAGCGVSVYEPRPSFQSTIASIVGNKRGVADISFVADPNTGVYIYDSTPYGGQSGWWIMGGTSVAAPCLAGVVNSAAAAGSGYAVNTLVEQNRIYSNMRNASIFRDVTSGTDGKFKASVGWDFITGVGSPIGLSGK